MTSKSITDRWERRGPEGRVRTARWGNGMRYLARYRDASGREHTKSFPDKQKAAAQRWLDEVTAAVVTGQYVDPRNARQSVRRYAQRWEQVQVGRPATLSIIDNALRLHILPALGDVPIGAVQKSDVQALVKRAGASGLSPRSVRNVYDVTTRMFAAAVDDRVIPSTPCRGISLPSVAREEISPLTAEEVEALADAMGFHRAPVLVLAGTGLRIGELLGLDVRHVDFLRRTIKVERQLTQSGEYGPTKTAESARTVPIGQATISVLAAHLEGRVPEGPLFTDEFGKPLSYGIWKARWKAATTSVGIDATTHDLRHFTASALIAGGASVKQVQSFLGHSSATITLRVYAHLWPGDDDRTRSIIDAVLLRDADQVRTESTSQTYSTRSGG